jgi:uncharacterized small protein (TIGR04563 family)
VSGNKRNLSLYFPEKMLREIGGEAIRQDRSVSWILQQAWTAARKNIGRQQRRPRYARSSVGCDRPVGMLPTAVPKDVSGQP